MRPPIKSDCLLLYLLPALFPGSFLAESGQTPQGDFVPTDEAHGGSAFRQETGFSVLNTWAPIACAEGTCVFVCASEPIPTGQVTQFRMARALPRFLAVRPESKT